MSKDIKEFVEMIKNDTAVQEKIKKAVEGYTGDKTDEAVWEAVLAPIASEAGFDVTLNDYMAYVDEIKASGELSDDEMAQIAGGAGFCFLIGGSGGAEASARKRDGCGACAFLGVGIGFFGEFPNQKPLADNDVSI